MSDDRLRDLWRLHLEDPDSVWPPDWKALQAKMEAGMNVEDGDAPYPYTRSSLERILGPDYLYGRARHA